MSTPSRPTAALSADEVNEAIRRLLVRAGGRLSSPADRAEYARLVVQWAAAQRVGLIDAA
ncbi:hypothetical protein ACWGLG_16670 [Streptomyces antimycoticus]